MSGSSLKKAYAGVPEMMVPLESTDESGKREMKELIEEKKKELIEDDDNKLSDNTYLKKEEFPVLRPSLKSSCFRMSQKSGLLEPSVVESEKREKEELKRKRQKRS